MNKPRISIKISLSSAKTAWKLLKLLKMPLEFWKKLEFNLFIYNTIYIFGFVTENIVNEESI